MNQMPEQKDMYDYIGNGNTMYERIDRELGGILQGDYSINSLLKNIRTMFNSPNNELITNFIESCGDTVIKNYNNEIFSNVTDSLCYSINPASREYRPLKKRFSATETQELLQKLQEISPEENKYNTVDEYVQYLKDNNFKQRYYGKFERRDERDSFLQEANNLIIDAAVQVIPDNELYKCKKMLLKYFYTPPVINEYKAKYPNRAVEHCPEWEEIDFICKTLTKDQEVLAEYDSYVEKYNAKMKEHEEREKLIAMCESKRKRSVISNIVSSLTPAEKNKAQKNGIESVLFGDVDRTPSRKGTFEWGVQEYEEPRLLCDKLAKYSEKGQENQRVIALSYGKFKYGTMFKENKKPTITSNLMELVGITRLGKDVNNTYFVLMPFDDVTLKKDYDFNEEDKSKERQLLLGNKRLDLKDTQGNDVHLVAKEKIPKELEDYYAKVAFSDEYLSAVVEDNYRFAGNVIENGKTPRISASYTGNAYDIEAAKYASKHPGFIGSRSVDSLDSYCNSPVFLSKHLELVRDIYYKSYKENKRDIKQGDAR